MSITPRLVEEEIASCTRCHLARAGVAPVPFRGPVTAPIAVVAEAPGKVENQVGKPLVGPAGQLLDETLAATGIDITNVMYMNVVSCLPYGTPTDTDIAACRIHLERQLLISKARHVLVLGRIALQSFVPNGKITQLRGSTFEQDGRVHFVALHPAAILRNQEWKPQWVADLEAFARMTKE